MNSKLFPFLLLLVATPIFSQQTRSAEEATGIEIGASAPVFSAIDANGNDFNLSEALEKEPVVLIFYRGFWCPYCNKHIAQVQDSLKYITEKGATVIAVSPEKPEYLKKMEEKTNAKFSLLYDDGYKISDAYNVTFTPKKATLLIYNKALGATLKESHSDDSERLPIPATYIIDKSGTIVWRQVDPDYKNRSTVKEILEHLPQ